MYRREWQGRTVRIWLRVGLIVIVAAELTVGLVFSQEQPRASILPRKTPLAEEAARSDIRAEVNMVLIPVSVSDRWDHPLTNLTTNAFHLFEDEIEQTIQSFSYEDGPVSIGFIFDASSSMRCSASRLLVRRRQLFFPMVLSEVLNSFLLNDTYRDAITTTVIEPPGIRYERAAVGRFPRPATVRCF